MADIPSIFADPTDMERQVALANALRRQQQLGLLGQLSGDKVLGNVGGSLLADAQNQAQLNESGNNRRLQLNLEAKKDAATEDYRRKELDLRGREVRDRENSELWGQPFGGADGKLYQQNRKSGDIRPASVDGEQIGAPPKGGAAASLAADKFKESVLEKLGKDLDPYQGRANLTADGQRAVHAAQRVETLLNSPGPITPQRVEELTIMAATVANGGKQPTESQVHGMLPKTWKGDAAQFFQYVTANPQDAGVQAFLEQTRQQSEREKATALAQNRHAFLQKLANHSTAFKKYPEEANRIAKRAGLEGLYDPDTLEILKDVDPVEAAGQQANSSRGKKDARIQELIKSGMRDAGAIQQKLREEGLLGG